MEERENVLLRKQLLLCRQATADILLGIQAHGPLLFTGAFGRTFGMRFYQYGHVIVVDGVEDDKVWFHDPSTGMEVFKASQHLDWDTSRNARHPLKSLFAVPLVHAYRRQQAAAAVARR